MCNQDQSHALCLPTWYMKLFKMEKHYARLGNSQIKCVLHYPVQLV